MADKAHVIPVSKHVARYDFPSGLSLLVKKPTNRIHRLLVEQPDQQIRYMMQTIAANCIVEMTLPPGYSEDHEEGATLKFDPKDVSAKHYERFDAFTLYDQQLYAATFESLNSPDKPAVEALMKAINVAVDAKK